MVMFEFATILKVRVHAQKTVIAIIVACIGHLSALGVASASTQSDARVSAALQALQRYKTSDSLRDLSSAVTMMDGTIDLTALTPQNFTAKRRNLVQAWAKILAAIEQSYDPTFDPADPRNLPSACVVPPKESDGTQLPACADPNELKDPNARESYVAAIQTNNQLIERSNYYQQVLRLDERAMRGLQMSIQLLKSVEPEGTGTDFSALDAIVQQAGISQARRTKIDGFLSEQPTT
jgi:hypothetical protein